MRLACAALLLASASCACAGEYGWIARGQYLVELGDCQSCHTAAGGAPFAGGRAIATPFGTIYSANITPDRSTGIGAWSDDDFYRALHEGIDRDGNHLYPAFPYPWYTRMSRSDVDAIHRYLMTLAPAINRPPANVLDWPLNHRSLLGVWNEMYFTPGEMVVNTSKSPAWNRGAYLVQGAGHCTACHSPKNVLGATENGHAFEGGIGGGWMAPDLTHGSRGGVQDWSADEIVEYLKTGTNKHSSAAGPMSEVVRYSTQHLADDDLRAIATYLKDLPNQGPAPASDASASAAAKAGAGIYLDQCSGCHMKDGKGVPQAIPSLAGSAIAQARDPSTAERLVLEGSSTVSTQAKPAGFAMPGFGGKLNDDEIANVLSYVRHSWNNSAPDVRARDVASMRSDIAKQPVAQ